MDDRKLDPLSSVRRRRVARAVACIALWASFTTVATWLVNDRGNTPQPLRVLTVQPAHAGPGGSTPSDVGDAVLRAQAQHDNNVQLLQAAALEEAARKAQVTTTTVRRAAPRPAPVARPVSGDCNAWLAAAGVQDTTSALALIARESGCNPYAVNRSSGACGVAQELPCGKSGCSLGDGACQVLWMDGYVTARYGSWANALAFQIRNNWY